MHQLTRLNIFITIPVAIKSMRVLGLKEVTLLDCSDWDSSPVHFTMLHTSKGTLSTILSGEHIIMIGSSSQNTQQWVTLEQQSLEHYSSDTPQSLLPGYTICGLLVLLDQLLRRMTSMCSTWSGDRVEKMKETVSGVECTKMSMKRGRHSPVLWIS